MRIRGGMLGDFKAGANRWIFESRGRCRILAVGRAAQRPLEESPSCTAVANPNHLEKNIATVRKIVSEVHVT